MGLDLSRIEAFTREMLEAEARRRSIRGPEFRTRGELIRLILRHQYGDRFNAGRDRIAAGRRTLAQAREIVGVALGAALSSLPEPLESLLGLRARRPLPPQARPTAPTSVPARPEPQRAEPRPTATPAAPVRPTAEDTPPAIPPQATPKTRTFIEEPIRTRSMARLLAAQNHRERALAIYDELLSKNADDETLHDEVAAVRRGEVVQAPLQSEPPFELERLSFPSASDRLTCKGEPSEGFSLCWQITEDGLRRARAVLGREGELTVRVICVRPDPERIVRSEITEHGPLPLSGEWQAPVLPSSARCFAAVGLRHAERFVAIVHTHPGAKRAEGMPSARPAASA